MEQRLETQTDPPYSKVIQDEKEQLRLRRKKLNIEHGTLENENWFGIALSGGGIRSATINLGLLNTLNSFGILKKADYLSSVSGGGYTHGFVQATAKNLGTLDLFNEKHIEGLREHGDYLTPEKGILKTANSLLLLVAVVVSWFMTILSPLILFGILYYTYDILAGLLGSNPFSGSDAIAPVIAIWTLRITGGVFALHFFINILLNYHLGISKFFNKIETVLAVILIAVYAWIMVASIEHHNSNPEDWLLSFLKIITLFVLGFYINPNAISLHRFYRGQLANLFLKFSGPFQNIPLHQLFNANSTEEKDYLAPYPLVNTCLNLQNPGGDEKFKGIKASDYFLLSPMYCGSKLTGYQRTTFYDDYRNLTLPAAVTISAAAVNPGMGMYSSKLLSVLMTLFNARFGCWVSNPLVLEKAYALVWWPVYFFKELLGRIGSRNKMVNISDGGHIENFGAYELLRRGCRLIIAVDAGEDRDYAFSDLNNFLLRARNELGLEIQFRKDQQPEDVIRPRPSQVYSQQRFAVADILQYWDDGKIIDKAAQTGNPGITNFYVPRPIGIFVYVKSAAVAPVEKPNLDGLKNKKDADLKTGPYYYKIFHPEFPHESTGDQAFDRIQWESYYQLGRFIGAEILGLKSPTKFKKVGCPDIDFEKEGYPDLTVEALLNWFDNPQEHALFGAPQQEYDLPVAETEIDDYYEALAKEEAAKKQDEPVKASRRNVSESKQSVEKTIEKPDDNDVTEYRM